MIDIEFLRQHPDVAEHKFRERGVSVDVNAIIKTDAEYRLMLKDVERLRAERNAKSPSAAQDQSVREDLKKLKVQLASEEALRRQLKDTLDTKLADLPNLQADDVPVGQNEKGNVVLKEVGRKPKLKEAKDYLVLAEALNIIDIQRAGKVSGPRFGYLLGDFARLEFALIQYCQNLLMPEGFTLVIPPVMIKAENMAAMGYLAGGGETETYHLKDDDLYLVGTSEQSIGPMHRDETFRPEQLPKRYLSFSTCFRREAGSYGKDTKGILRVHQFDKLEMFSFTAPDQSDAEHEFLLRLEEKIVQGLQLPYRVVKLCSGDLGYPSARTYDIEIWMPSEGKYRETHSTSTTTDYQARALNIRLAMDDRRVFCHMLNGTAVTNRTTIAIIENYQQSDGSIAIPKVLQPYLNGLKKIEKK